MPDGDRSLFSPRAAARRPVTRPHSGRAVPAWARASRRRTTRYFFPKPTESSEQLRDNAERRVTFHTADLSAQERQVIEAGFTESQFEVCFATSTLAAGVNFPFRSIVFPEIPDLPMGRSGSIATSRASIYRNMSDVPDTSGVTLTALRSPISRAIGSSLSTEQAGALVQ